jgi:hypothetical protein
MSATQTASLNLPKQTLVQKDTLTRIGQGTVHFDQQYVIYDLCNADT